MSALSLTVTKTSASFGEAFSVVSEPTTATLATPGTSEYLDRSTLDHLLSRREGRATITTGASSGAAAGVSFAPTA